MTLPLTLGRAPERLRVHLARGGPFTAHLRCQSGGTETPWPVGTTLRLVIHGGSYQQSWTWTIDGADASLTIPADQVDALPNRTLTAQLWLDYGAGEFLWCSGEVEFHA